jgi:hypothetical protein
MLKKQWRGTKKKILIHMSLLFKMKRRFIFLTKLAFLQKKKKKKERKKEKEKTHLLQ